MTVVPNRRPFGRRPPARVGLEPADRHAPFDVRIGLLLGAACLMMAAHGATASEPVASTGAAALSTATESPLPTGFDPGRDALADLRSALALATARHKRVLVDVGGDWCSACVDLDRFFARHAELRARRDDAFVYLRVNVSDANANAPTIERLPWFFGYPHWFVLDSDGSVLDSRFATFDVKSFDAFVARWPPPGR